MLDGRGEELINSSLDDAISLFGLLDAVDGFFDLVESLKVINFGIRNCIRISYLEEHLIKEKVGHHRDEWPDVRHQWFDSFIGCEKQHQIGQVSKNKNNVCETCVMMQYYNLAIQTNQN